MTAEPWQYAASGRTPALSPNASLFDRLCLDPGPRPAVAPCAACAPEREAAATREAEWRRAYGAIEFELATANREIARLRRLYEGGDDGQGPTT